MSENAGQADDVFERIDACLARAESHVHLLGINGVGMAGLAILLKQRGFTVSGCDSLPGPLAASLDQHGIETLHGHDPDHLQAGVDWVVASTAVPRDQPERQQAEAAGIPVFRRGDVLARVVTAYPTILVCGTHGKTTTATFIVQMLRAAGRNATSGR